jgi:hypothetical protein
VQKQNVPTIFTKKYEWSKQEVTEAIKDVTSKMLCCKWEGTEYHWDVHHTKVSSHTETV